MSGWSLMSQNLTHTGKQLQTSQGQTLLRFIFERIKKKLHTSRVVDQNTAAEIAHACSRTSPLLAAVLLLSVH